MKRNLATFQALLDSGFPMKRSQLESHGLTYKKEDALYSVFAYGSKEYKFIRLLGQEYVYMREA